MDEHAVIERLDSEHDPGPGLGMEGDLGIAEVLGPSVEDGIARIAGPREAVVRGVGDRLGLDTWVRGVLRAVGARVEGHERPGPTLRREAGDVLRVMDDAPGEHHLVLGELQGDGQLLPRREVVGDGVAPGQVVVRAAQGVVLEEEMPPAVVPDEPIGVVHPGRRRREVESGTVSIRRGQDLCSGAHGLSVDGVDGGASAMKAVQVGLGQAWWAGPVRRAGWARPGVVGGPGQVCSANRS